MTLAAIHFRSLRTVLVLSRCLKLYCQCFALSTTCGPKCKCQTCFNTTLHAESIEDARKTILERNPSAFDDKFRGGAFTPSPFRGPPPSVPMYHQASPPTTVWPTSVYRTPSAPPAPLAASPPGSTLPPPRVNKFGCKCRRSFCLKKVNIVWNLNVLPRIGSLFHSCYLLFSIVNATKIQSNAASTVAVQTVATTHTRDVDCRLRVHHHPLCLSLTALPRLDAYPTTLCLLRFLL